MRQSPIEHCFSQLPGDFGQVGDMRTFLRLADSQAESLNLETIGLADCSFLERTGLKGPLAMEFLSSLGLPVPQRPNHWEPLEGGGILMRLGMTEFFIEDGPSGGIARLISEKLGMDGIEGAYPVRRQDAALILCGTKQNDFLSQTCNVNFAEIDEKNRQVVMTNMVGVSVVMVQNKINERYSWKIWCDGTFGHYFWETLFGITLEMGGGAVGCNRLYPGLA